MICFTPIQKPKYFSWIIKSISHFRDPHTTFVAHNAYVYKKTMGVSEGESSDTFRGSLHKSQELENAQWPFKFQKGGILGYPKP